MTTTIHPARCPNFVVSVDKVNTRAVVMSRTHGHKLRSHARHGDVEAWVLGRLYYSDELAARFGIERLVVGKEADFVSRLVAVKGEDSIKLLEGDYAVTVFDHSTQTLFAARDGFGGYPLFVYEQDEQITVATSAQLIEPDQTQNRLSAAYLARFLTLPMAIYSETLQAESPFEGIESIKPGHIRRWSLRTGKHIETLFQGYADAVVNESAYRSSESFHDAIHNAMKTSIAERAVGNVACHSSSGMDSTVVATLLDQLSANNALSGSCDAISMVYQADPLLKAETPFIDAVQAELSMPIHRILGDDCVNYAPIANGIHCQLGTPNAFLTRLPIHAWLTRTAADLKADTILTGAGGDHLFENHPTVLLADDLQNRRYCSAYSRTRQLSNRTGASRIQSALNAIHTLRWANPSYGRFECPKRTPWGLKSEYSLPDWYNPEFLKNASLASQMQTAIVADANHELLLGWYYDAIFAPAMGDQMRWTLAAPLGIHIAHPYFDRRLCSLILQAPLDLRFGFKGDKGLSATVFDRELPSALKMRKSKIGLRDLMTRGFTEHYAQLTQMVTSCSPMLDDWVDRGRLLQALQIAKLGVFQSAIALDRLNLVLSVADWLNTRCDRTEIPPFSISR